MARIPRKTQKVFCGNSNAGEIAVFGTMKTGTPQYSTDIETLQSNEYELGWSDAILNDKAPYLEEMNGVQYTFSRQIAYLLQQGLANEWDTNTIYFKGSTVALINDTAVTYYRSVSNNNQGNNPTSDDGTNWVLDSISKIEDYNTALTNAVNTLDTSVVKLTGNQTVAGNKTFTGTTKVPNSATVGTAIATAAISKGAIGYLKLGNGIIIQWEKRAVSSGSVGAKQAYNRDWTFPTAFTTNNVVCITAANNEDFTGSTKSTNSTKASFSYKNTNTSNADSFSYVFSYAIGY